jgi:hypothetical protein
LRTKTSEINNDDYVDSKAKKGKDETEFSKNFTHATTSKDINSLVQNKNEIESEKIYDRFVGNESLKMGHFKSTTVVRQTASGSLPGKY